MTAVPHLIFLIVFGAALLIKNITKENILIFTLIPLVFGTGYIIYGYPYFDDIGLILIITSILINKYFLKKSVLIKKSNIEHSQLPFLYFLTFLTFSVIVGVYSSGDYTKLIWFSLVYILYFYVRLFQNNVLINKSTPDQVIKIGVAYFTSILAYSFVAEYIRDYPRWWLQTAEMNSSVMIMAPMLIFLPLVIIKMNIKFRFFSNEMFLFLLIVYVSLYFDSRTSYFILVVTLMLLMRYLKLRLFMFLAFSTILFVAIYLPFSGEYKGDFNHLIENITRTGEFFYDNDSKLDYLRVIHSYATLNVLTDNLVNFTFGNGWRMHSSVLPSFLIDQYLIYLPDQLTEVTNLEGTTGINALIIDGGIFLLISFLLSYYVSIKQIYRSNSKFKTVFIIYCGLSMFLWATANMQSNVLLYFLFMPYGLFWQLNSIFESYAK